MSSIRAKRYHDISCGHRVHGHESACAKLHGHNYRIHFTVEASDGELDDIGRVLDFSVIKSRLCQWLEDNWDHKFLAWEHDPIMNQLHQLVTGRMPLADSLLVQQSIVWVPFNPTAENMAQYLCEEIGPARLEGTSCKLVSVMIEETMKCHAEFSL